MYGRIKNLDAPILADLLFGDTRRKVDVTFHVGLDSEPVHVTGILDYVFFDWRTDRRRIIDYKLTPGNEEQKDLFQVCLYALMHHIQHRTESDAAVFYLHPRRHMVEVPWQQIRPQTRNRVRSLGFHGGLGEVRREDGQGTAAARRRILLQPLSLGQSLPGPPRAESQGSRCTRWAEAAAADQPEPKIERRDPPEVVPEETDDLSRGEDALATGIDSAQAGPEKTGPTIRQPEEKPLPPVDPIADGELAADLLWLGQSEADSKVRIGMPKGA